MLYKTLPDTDLRCSAFCLGAGPIGSTIDKAASFRMLDAFAEAGGNFVDTAHIYADWLPGEKAISEKTIGAWIKERRNRARIVIGTKGAHPLLGNPQQSRLTKDCLQEDLDGSLTALQTDYIDLYWLHRDDQKLPVAEILESLNNFIKAGKIRAFGCSNWREHRLAEAREYGLRNNLKSFVAIQNLWSLAFTDMKWMPDPTLHTMDPSLVHYCKRNNVAAIPYSAQAGGFFTKKAVARQLQYDPKQKGSYEAQLNYDRLGVVLRCAQDLHTTVTAVVLAYLTSQPFCAIPVIGPKTTAQLADCLTGADLQLTPEHIDALERAAWV
jgi:aryl-alcohol dehydrogenase-like predicted oxidoreductase